MVKSMINPETSYGLARCLNGPSSLTDAGKAAVKKVARMLLQTLKEAKLVLDWRKKQTTWAVIYSAVKIILHELPRAYTPELYDQKCDRLCQHVYDSYQGEGRSIYGAR